MSLLLLLLGAGSGTPTAGGGDTKIILGQKESLGISAVPTIGNATFGTGRLKEAA